MENGSKIDGPFIDEPAGRSAKVSTSTITSPTSMTATTCRSGSLGAQPQIWVNVALIDPNGETVWESGYVDSNGDMADLHSLDVAAGEIEHDDQLWNLQTKFLTTNVKGTDREMYSAGQLRHRSAAVHPTGRGADHRAQPSAPHSYGEPTVLAAAWQTVKLNIRYLRMRSPRLAPIVCPCVCGAAPSRSTSCASWRPPSRWSRP